MTGVSGKVVRTLKVEDLTLLVSDCDEGSLPVTRENALAHAAVVRSVLDQTTPLPFRFGMLATEQQLQKFITTNKPALAGKLAHVRGRIEMNLKIMLNSITEAAAQLPGNDESPGPGTAFLMEKRRELLGDAHTAARISELSSLLRERISSGLIKDEQISLRQSLAAVAHLIDSRDIQQYRENVAEFCQNRPDLPVLVSGPWPPYTFANIELEFHA